MTGGGYSFSLFPTLELPSVTVALRTKPADGGAIFRAHRGPTKPGRGFIFGRANCFPPGGKTTTSSNGRKESLAGGEGGGGGGRERIEKCKKKKKANQEVQGRRK